MRGRIGVVAAVTVAALLAGCGSDADQAGVPPDSSAPIISETTASGTTFDVDVGEQFTIVLDSNVTTGYSWQLEAELDAAVLALVSDDYVAPEDTAAVGAGGQQRLTFEAVGEGTTTIELWYIRPFDDPPDPAEQASYPVTVAG